MLEHPKMNADKGAFWDMRKWSDMIFLMLNIYHASNTQMQPTPDLDGCIIAACTL